MNKVILQLWEESERGYGSRPDGCSIHIDEKIQKEYTDISYKNRGDDVPDVYERLVGDPFFAFIEDGLFEILKRDGSIRLFEYELNNLIHMEELIINHD